MRARDDPLCDRVVVACALHHPLRPRRRRRRRGRRRSAHQDGGQNQELREHQGGEELQSKDKYQELKSNPSRVEKTESNKVDTKRKKGRKKLKKSKLKKTERRLQAEKTESFRPLGHYPIPLAMSLKGATKHFAPASRHCSKVRMIERTMSFTAIVLFWNRRRFRSSQISYDTRRSIEFTPFLFFLSWSLMICCQSSVSLEKALQVVGFNLLHPFHLEVLLCK